MCSGVPICGISLGEETEPTQPILFICSMSQHISVPSHMFTNQTVFHWRSGVARTLPRHTRSQGALPRHARSQGTPQHNFRSAAESLTHSARSYFDNEHRRPRGEHYHIEYITLTRYGYYTYNEKTKQMTHEVVYAQYST